MKLIDVSPVSATLYTFMANAQAWYGFLQNVYKFLYTALHQKRARTLAALLRHILCLLLCLFIVTSSAHNKHTYTVRTHKKMKASL